jgi:flagellum-specific ATP synthase
MSPARRGSPDSLQAMQAFMLGSTSFVGWTSFTLMLSVWLLCVLAAWLMGRVLDGLGLPFDGGPLIEPDVFVPLRGDRLNPLDRAAVTEPLDVGVRAINSFLTVGQGQRIGLIAGSGVGKSMLLGMITKFSAADVIVIGCIGERGREVLDFVNETLGPETLKRSVVIAAPGDYSPIVRLRATHLTSAVAEYFRDRGKRVLLLMDSLTRVAHAQREVGLAVGEPPTTKGYTPSVFSLINEIVERAGKVSHGGSITAIYTVLAEGDDANDPIVDAARAILDGHVLLSRDLAALCQYPAIDLGASVSRLAMRLISSDQRELVMRFRRLMSVFDLSEIQANYILDMPLRRLTKFSRIELEGEEKELKGIIAALNKLLKDPEAVRTAVADELKAQAKIFATPRKTRLGVK